jgi:hypothetical protein
MTETFCDRDVLFRRRCVTGDVLLRRRLVWRRFVEKSFRVSCGDVLYVRREIQGKDLLYAISPLKL